MCKCRSHGTFPFRPSSSHLNICYYHQDLHARPLRPGSRLLVLQRRRAPSYSSGLALAPTAGIACGPPPEFPLASPRSGIVHHLSGPDRYALTRNPSQKIRVGRRCNPQEDPTNQLPCALRVYSPLTRTHVRLLWSVFQDGSNGTHRPTPGARKCRSTAESARAAVHNRDDDVSASISTPQAGPPSQSRRSSLESIGGPAQPFHIRPRHIAGPHPLPPDNFSTL
ncbi:hypothetical protein KIW84_UN0774 [Lathyrus oleraceus]|nr:hypothetical protein KIW84_UN0774 [Pisum sativum]